MKDAYFSGIPDRLLTSIALSKITNDLKTVVMVLCRVHYGFRLKKCEVNYSELKAMGVDVESMSVYMAMITKKGWFNVREHPEKKKTLLSETYPHSQIYQDGVKDHIKDLVIDIGMRSYRS